MQFTIKLILPVFICIQLTQASLKVKFSIRNATSSADSYFNAARLSTANAYVGAQCEVGRDLICEPLTFDWLSTATYKDDVIYLMKTCVLESFDEKVKFDLFLLVCLIYWSFFNTYMISGRWVVRALTPVRGRSRVTFTLLVWPIYWSFERLPRGLRSVRSTPRHTKDVIKMVPKASLLSAQHIRIILASLSSQNTFTNWDVFHPKWMIEGNKYKLGKLNCFTIDLKLISVK